MPSLQVRDMPEELYRQLQRNAKREHRSISQQAIITIQKGLELREDSKTRRRELIEQILRDGIGFNTDKLQDPTKLIREDRNR